MQERKTDSILIMKILARLPYYSCLALLHFYRTLISPLKPRVCRFYPSCSQYYYEAVIKYGAVRGTIMGLKRLSCCHPFHPGGYDPVD